MLPVDSREAMPTPGAPSPRAIAAVFAVPLAQRPETAGNADNGKVLRFPSRQSSGSHADHITYRVVRQPEERLPG